MCELQRIGAYLDIMDRQRVRISVALCQELSENDRREQYCHQALNSMAWDPPGPVRDLSQHFEREAHRACAEAKAATAALPSHLGQHWLMKLERLQSLHDRLLEAAIDGHEQFRPLAVDLCNQHALATAEARQERLALDLIEHDGVKQEAEELRRPPGVPQVGTRSGGLRAPEQRAQALKDLPPAARKAYLAYCWAEAVAGRPLEDREAFDILKEQGIPKDRGDLGELEDYELPDFPTWTKHLRNARAPLGEQKYKRRGGRATGKSIVRANQI
jgi:hypothetical protein